MPNEPSMEEILSSIKRIIAEEDRTAPTPRAPRKVAAPRAAEPAASSPAPMIDADADDQILELTEIVPADAQPDVQAPKLDAAKPPPPKAPKAETRPEPKPEVRMDTKAPKSEARPARAAATPAATAEAAAVLSDLSAKAARDSLDNLSRLLVRNDDGQSNTLEGLVREMLRPMLKDWLDANLPPIVETMVKREIDRITGRV